MKFHNMTKLGGAALIALLSILSACGSSDMQPMAPGGGGVIQEPPDDGGDDPPEITACLENLSGGDTQVSSSTQMCPLCSVTEESQAIDGERATYSTISVDPVGGSVTLRATAQPGVTFPSGYEAGAIMRLPMTSDPNLAVQLCLSTYLGSTMQESDSNYCSSPGVVSGISGGEDAAYTFKTSKPFDSVEISINRSGGMDPLEFRVYEFCGHQ